MAGTLWVENMRAKHANLNREYPFLYLLPAFAVLFILIFLPLVTNIIRSFSVRDVFPTLDNYKRLFTDKSFLIDLKNTFVWLLYTLPFEMILGLLIAILLNMKIKGRKLYRTLFIIPWVLPASVVCIIWKWMYNADYGILNYILLNLGLIDKYQLWINSAAQSLACQAAVYVWKISPFVMIMYLSGLQNISEDIYDAAKIDGAGWLRQVFQITIPLLFPVMRSSSFCGSIHYLSLVPDGFSRFQSVRPL